MFKRTGKVARPHGGRSTIDRMAHNGSNKKVANGLVALSSAAVLAVYAAGYSRTRSAADQLEAKSAERRPAMPTPPRTAAPAAQPTTAAGTPEHADSTPSPVTRPAATPAADKPGTIASAVPAVAVAHDLPHSV